MTESTENFKNVNFINLSVENKILKINQIIQNFPDERKVDICENCRKKHGDFKQYNNFLQDTGICSLCFKTNDLLNYSILELVEKSGLNANEYYNYVDEVSKITYNGLRISTSYREMEIKKNEIFLSYENFRKEELKLSEKYPSILYPFLYNKDQSIRQNFIRLFDRFKKLHNKDIREKNHALYIKEHEKLMDKYF